MFTVSRILLYPIKSCGGVPLQRAEIGARGLQAGAIGDRRWMISGADGVMITQRQNENLARVRIELLEDAIRVSGDGLEPVVVDPAETLDERAGVLLFGREVPGHRVPKAIDDWFSRFLGQPARLLRQTEEDHRLCDPDFAVAPGEDKVGFADAFPYLLSSEATLERLNTLLPDPVPMNRFRPNIVVGGTGADAEYGWKRLAAGEAEFSIVKPCTRCIVTTIDQEMGMKTGKEPLAALGRAYFLSAAFGQVPVKGAIFGENAIATRLGALAVGDPVRVLEEKPPHAFRAEEGSVSVAG
jgi:uncharacterized protein YcbX